MTYKKQLELLKDYLRKQISLNDKIINDNLDNFEENEYFMHLLEQRNHYQTILYVMEVLEISKNEHNFYDRLEAGIYYEEQ